VDAHIDLPGDKYAPLLIKFIARHKHNAKGQRQNYEVLINAGADVNAISMGKKKKRAGACLQYKVLRCTAGVSASERRKPSASGIRRRDSAACSSRSWPPQ
jgi:hypothetical protein